MSCNAMTEHYEEITVCGKPALFTNFRIKRDTVPDGLYAYDVRHDDDCRGIPCEIAPFIMVNHWGTIILAEPLELPNDGRRYIDEETDWNYDPFGGAEKNQKALRDGGRVYESVSEPLIRASRVVPYKVQKSSQGTDGANRSSTEIIF